MLEEAEGWFNAPDTVRLDKIQMQVEDLVKCRNPKQKLKQNKEKLKQLVDEYLTGRSFQEIGNWVYYPWSKTAVHLLPEDEFVEVRTNRNKHKITDEEQGLLGTKVVGVIGLSVGQSVATAMTLERVFKEIRLADFDEIELSNLNRIRTKVSNIGLNKAVSVAREIYEIDPYLNVVVYEKGLDEQNIDDFFTKGGTIDLLVEECDGLDMKVLARHKARALKIPVVMEASDKCMLDVERFDLEPNRPILHGLLEDLSIQKLKTLKTDEEKIPYLLDMIGYETISDRLKASMVEIEETITTWPQLGSAVVMGGGICCDVIRNILLGLTSKSGRYYVDVENLDQYEHTFAFSETGRFNIKDDVFDERRNDVEKVIYAGSLAPSVGNSQPWHFSYKNSQIQVYLKRNPDQEHLLDFDYIGSIMSLGAVYTNLKVAAELLHGHVLKEKVDLYNLENKPIIEMDLSNLGSQQNNTSFFDSKLFKRKTNRSVSESALISQIEIDKILEHVPQVEGINFNFAINRADIVKTAQELGVFDQIRYLNERSFDELMSEIRWTEEETLTKRDGLDLELFDFTEAEKAGWRLLRDKKIIMLLNQFKLGEGLQKYGRKSFANSGGIGIISGLEYNRATYFQTGMMLESFWLKATELGIDLHPMTAYSFVHQESVTNPKSIFDATKDKIVEHSAKIKKMVQMPKNHVPLFVFRMTKDITTSKRATRKFFDTIIDAKK